MNNSLLRELDTKEIIVLKLEQPNLMLTIEKLKELKDFCNQGYNFLNQLSFELKDLTVNKEDNYILKEIDRIGTKDKLEETSLTEIKNLIYTINRKLEYTESLIKKIETEYVVLKREECEQCKTKESFLLPMKNKRICSKCYDSNYDKEVKMKKKQLNGDNNE